MVQGFVGSASLTCVLRRARFFNGMFRGFQLEEIDEFSILNSRCQNVRGINIGALIITIGFRGPLYYNENKEHPK